MLQMLFAIAGTAGVLILSEILCQKRILKGEFARKFVHIVTATFAAFWPLFLSFEQIALLSLIFVAVLIIVKQLKLFTSLKSVKRATYGEIWYALGIGVTALIFQNAQIFAVAILTMALADGFAAVVGVGMGKKARRFKINGHQKTWAGTATFLLISFTLNAIYWFVLNPSALSADVTNAVLPLILSGLAATILTCAELLSPKGSDNVIVPVLAGFLVWLPGLFF